MRYNVILIALCIILVWLIGVQILMRILEDSESRPETPKESMHVKVKGYSKDTNPPTLIVESKTGKEIYLRDYDRKFDFAAQVYYNKWVCVELVNHYYGLLFIRMSKKVYSLRPIYK